MPEEKFFTGITRLPQPSLCDWRVPVAVAAVPRPLIALRGLINTLRVAQEDHLDRHGGKTEQRRQLAARRRTFA